MSASSKKKQRKVEEETVISSRQQEELAKQAQRKRNTIIYSIIGVVVVILVAILLIWDSGIVQRNTAVATINGEKVTASQVAYYYNNNDVIYYANLYNAWGISGFPYNTSASPKAQLIDDTAVEQFGLDESYLGKTYHEYFMDYAMNSLRDEYVLRAAAKDAGYTMSDEGKASVEAEIDSIDDTLDSYLTNYGVDMSRKAYLQSVYGKSMSVGKLRTCLENAVLAQEYYDLAFDTLADYTDEELNSYYQEHTSTLDTITYYWRQFDGTAESTTDADGNTVEPTEEETEAAMAAAKAEAEAALAQVEGKLSAVENDEDYTKASGVLSDPSAFYYDWLMDSDREAGDATIFDGASSYYVVVYGDRFLDETPTVNVRHILVKAANEDDPATEDVDESTQEPTDEAYAAAKEKAQELLEQWKSGAATEESFAALAGEYSADTGSNTKGGLYENVTYGSMIDNFNDWIFDDARQSGDVSEPIQNTESSTKGWHIIYFIGQDEPAWVLTARRNLWSAEVAANTEVVRTDKLDSMFD